MIKQALVYTFENLQNHIRIYTQKAVVKVERYKKDNNIVFKNYLYLKTDKKKIPLPDIKYFFWNGEKYFLYLYRASKDLYLPILVENKKMYVVINDEKKLIFDGEIALKENEIVNINYFITQADFDKDKWLAQEFIELNEKYRNKSFWEKYQNIIILVVASIFIIGTFYMGLSSLNDVFKKSSESYLKIAEALNNVANKLEDIAKAQKTEAPQQIQPLK